MAETIDLTLVRDGYFNGIDWGTSKHEDTGFDSSLALDYVDGDFSAQDMVIVTAPKTFIPGHSTLTDFDAPSTIPLFLNWTHVDGIGGDTTSEDLTIGTPYYAFRLWHEDEEYWLVRTNTDGISGETNIWPDQTQNISNGDEAWNIAVYVPLIFGPGESMLWGDNFQNATVKLNANVDVTLHFSNAIAESTLAIVQGPMGPAGPPGPAGPAGALGDWPYDGYNTLLDKLTYLERKVDQMTHSDVESGNVVFARTLPTLEGGGPDSDFDDTIESPAPHQELTSSDEYYSFEADSTNYQFVLPPCGPSVVRVSVDGGDIPSVDPALRLPDIEQFPTGKEITIVAGQMRGKRFQIQSDTGGGCVYVCSGGETPLLCDYATIVLRKDSALSNSYWTIAEYNYLAVTDDGYAKRFADGSMVQWGEADLAASTYTYVDLPETFDNASPSPSLIVQRQINNLRHTADACWYQLTIRTEYEDGSSFSSSGASVWWQAWGLWGSNYSA